MTDLWQRIRGAHRAVGEPGRDRGRPVEQIPPVDEVLGRHASPELVKIDLTELVPRCTDDDTVSTFSESASHPTTRCPTAASERHVMVPT